MIGNNGGWCGRVINVVWFTDCAGGDGDDDDDDGVSTVTGICDIHNDVAGIT